MQTDEEILQEIAVKAKICLERFKSLKSHRSNPTVAEVDFSYLEAGMEDLEISLRKFLSK